MATSLLLPETLPATAPETAPATGGAPIRVLFVSHSAKLFGAQRQLLDLVTAARALGVVPLVGVPGPGPLETALARCGVATVGVPQRRLVGTGLNFARRLVRAHLAAIEFGRRIPHYGVDLVHSNTLRTAFSALAARRAGLPHVWHFHELQRAWTEPGAFREARAMRRIVESTTRAVVVPSRALADQSAAYLPAGSRTIPNGLLRPEARHPLGEWRPEGELRILTLGREKNWTEAVDTLAELRRRGRPARWTFVGERDATRIRAYAAERGVADAARFVGYVDDPAPFLREADVHVLTSTYESFGRVLVEAMALGVPVVAHPRGGIPEIVAHGETGWLTPVDDVRAMAETLIGLADDPSRTAVIRRAAWEDVWERFTVDRFARSFDALYREVLAQGSGVRA